MRDRTEPAGASTSTVQNANYKADIRYATKVGSYILGLIGIWPAVFDGAGRFLPNIAILLGNLVIQFAVIPCALYIIFDEKNVIIQLKLFGLLSFCAISTMRYFALAFRRADILQCLKLVEEDWKMVKYQDDRQVMLKYGRMGRNLTIICASFMYVGGLTYHSILPALRGTHIDAENRTIKPVVYPVYSGFFEPQNTPLYHFVFAAHFACGVVIYTVAAGACGLAALFAMHACAQIEIVMSRLRDLTDGEIFDDGLDVNGRLKTVVQLHRRVLGFANMTERIMQELYLLEFGSSTFLICLLEYYCIVDWEGNSNLELTTYAVILISVTFNIFILCYIGQLLMDKSTNIGNTCFMADWYRLPVKTMRGMILIIIMSSNPMKISAGRMVDLNILAFGNIIKTSLAYLSFLRTTVRK